MNAARGFGEPGFDLDEGFEPVRLPGVMTASSRGGMEMFGSTAGYGMASAEDTYVIR